MIDFLVSCGVALLSGLGVGSGGLLVVFLTEYREVGQLFAQGVNLIFFIFSSGSSTAVNLRARNICYGAVTVMSVGGTVGAIVGALVASVLDPDLLRIGFGAMLLIGGIPSFIRSVKSFIIKKPVEIS
ncbi:MAG: sulfite exporter TauE/SafE family protein [Clostridia bacterium]|nr:sulfite exporter TauE/SafE family protein [Clostridia bacterium]